MGTCFSFFDERSHTTATSVDIGQFAGYDRQLLHHAMLQFGFLSYEAEYWHFDYYEQELNEPADFIITPEWHNQ